jgi:hypothetical protein
VTNSTPPPTAPDSLAAMQVGLDGRIPIGVFHVTTLASGSGGVSSGTGGGADVCAESAEIVDVRGKGNVAAGTVAIGDYILGWSFEKSTEVYRKVVQVKTQSSSAWRMVQSHRVSPCEPVYVNDQWMPAFRAPDSTFDSMVGTKMLISIESDSYNEQNYYLTEGDPLLIHNIVTGFPC